MYITFFITTPRDCHPAAPISNISVNPYRNKTG
jgi:hypothetical protein